MSFSKLWLSCEKSECRKQFIIKEVFYRKYNLILQSHRLKRGWLIFVNEYKKHVLVVRRNFVENMTASNAEPARSWEFPPIVIHGSSNCTLFRELRIDFQGRQDIWRLISQTDEVVRTSNFQTKFKLALLFFYQSLNKISLAVSRQQYLSERQFFTIFLYIFTYNKKHQNPCKFNL